ncbi:radical SAM protein [Candidatus Woesearchaeota archaeon]|nr:radical SAM protein [Candidatus Woesearchaeota archaeon]
MSEVSFEDMKFDGNIVKLLRNFSLELPDGELKKIGEYETKKGSIFFDGVSEKKARNKLLQLIEREIHNLRNDITGHSAVYVHRNSGIPLIGSAAFGIVDRNSSMIEVKPVTGCNMNCLFCSVDEGISSKKVNDFVVEEAYLVEECRKLVEFKGIPCQVAINAHGEPLIYAPMAELVRDLKAIKGVESISLITNGTFLTKELIDELSDAGLGSLNISMNAFSPEKAKIMQGTAKYDVEKVKEMASYAAAKFKVILAPVYVQGYNDSEMNEIVRFAARIGAKTGIQNFLYYPGGRNPAEQLQMDKFYANLRQLEGETGEKLIVDGSDFGIEASKPLQKPFSKGKVVRARIACDGRLPGEKIGAAKGRVITIPNCTREGMVSVKITRDKHNIFYGKAL